MSRPKKLHYVPKIHLKGFVREEKSPQVFVFDKRLGKSFVSHIDDAACKQNFYTQNVVGKGDPFAAEKFFSTVETTGSLALNHVRQHRSIPEGELFQRLLEFMALASVRVPAAIEAFDRPLTQVLNHELWHATRSEEAYKRFLQERRSDAKSKPSRSYEEARRLADSGGCYEPIPQNVKMDVLRLQLEPAVFLLGERNWSVVAPEENAPDFICSDRPFTLCWNIPKVGPYPPAMGVGDTTAMFPVSRRTALLGTFEKPNVPPQLSATLVGIINMHTAWSAYQCVYSGTEDFTVTLADGSLTNRQGFLDEVQRVRLGMLPIVLREE